MSLRFLSNAGSADASCPLAAPHVGPRDDEDTRVILSPCPFCGAEPRGIVDGDATFPAYVRCLSPLCGATGPESDNVLSAARLWNRRLGPQVSP